MGANRRTASRHWLIERRVRDYPRIFLVMFLLAVPLYALTFEGGVDARGQAMGSDFVLFWSAAELSVDGSGADVWDRATLFRAQLERHPGLAGPVPWAYPPTTLLLVTPLGLLPYPVAFVVWTAAGVVALLVAIRPLLRGLPHAWVALLAFPGLWLGVAQGQTQFVVAALAGAALLAVAPRPVLAGVLIGLLAVKPHLALLFPVALVAGRHRAALVSAAASATAFMAAGAVAFGAGSISAWIAGMRQLGSGIDAGAFPEHKFVTPYAAARTLGVPTETALVLQAAITVLVVVLVYVVWRRTDDVRLRGSALVLGTFLATPYAADYDLALLAFPIAWMAVLGVQEGWRRGERDLLAAAWLLPLVTAPIAAATQLTVTPVVVACLLRQVWVRTRETAPVTAQPSPATGRT